MALCHDMIYVRIICFLCFEVTFFVCVFGPIILLVFLLHLLRASTYNKVVHTLEGFGGASPMSTNNTSSGTQNVVSAG